MRRLAQPRVLISATAAALVSALAGYPRLSFWSGHLQPLWYLEAVIFLCGIVLWGFVFAWHTHYTRRPVFTLKPGLVAFGAATLAGIVVAAISYRFLDPQLRLKMPEDYPHDPAHWLANVLFSSALTQLFIVFAPFAWLMRLLQNQRMATVLTVLFGVMVLVLRARSLPEPLPAPLFAAFLAGRIVAGFLSVWFYLRGGLLLAWWWNLLIDTRLLLPPAGSS